MMQCSVSFVFYLPRPPQASSSCVHMVGYTTKSLSPLPLFPPHSSSSSSSSIYRAYEQSWNAAPLASTDQLFLIPSSLSLSFFLAPSSCPSPASSVSELPAVICRAVLTWAALFSATVCVISSVWNHGGSLEGPPLRSR